MTLEGTFEEFADAALEVIPRGELEELHSRVRVGAALADPLSREVYGVLGMPVDALNLDDLVGKIDAAAGGRQPFFVSTPNVNHLISSRSNPEFRESLLLSDVCSADGMPIVWISRLMGLPIKTRLAGSDLLDTLKNRTKATRRMKVFLFGGSSGAAAKVGELLNAQAGGLECVGSLNPGFGSVEEISSNEIIETINGSGADFLVVFLSAEKAQLWLRLNHDRLTIPVRAQFGAAINFQAGTVKRAPKYLQKAGLEWLWRIKEEPYLWRRYWSDGCKLIYVVLTCAVPSALGSRWHRLKATRQREDLQIDREEDDRTVTIGLGGAATTRQIESAVTCFRIALRAKKEILIDLSQTKVIDQRFFGLFLMLRKQLLAQGNGLQFTGASRSLKRMFQINGFEFLLHSR